MNRLVRILAWVAAASCVLLACDSARPEGDASILGDARFGEPCATSSDCASGRCLVVGASASICTRACDVDADCPGARNWACIDPSDWDERICGCVADGAVEVCGDGRDNDCDGDVDDCRFCGGFAVATDDPEHCGVCFHACRADETCRSGECRCANADETECDGWCVDVREDDAHCGACGNACGIDQDCVDGACTCSETRPDQCADGCVDLDADPRHCGSCDRSCADGQSCIGGECGCAAGERDDVCPGDLCVDLQSDERNCGACGVTCRASEVCSGGECACPGEATSWCGDACRDVRSDETNCGACGVGCGAGQTCVEGACECLGLVCGDLCVDRSDLANCGACGNTCGAGARCTGGECTCLAGSACGAACVDLARDGANCGACGRACGAGLTCVAGECACPRTGWIQCGGTCVDPRSDEANCGACGAGCPVAESCVAGACGCGLGASYCPSSSECVDVLYDEQNCGTCGTVCAPPLSCVAGSCACGGAAETWCGATTGCVLLASDRRNCGACGVTCASSTVCASGACRCPTTGETYCAASDSCRLLATDVTNCGSCGRACPPGATCTGGSCRCPAGGSLCALSGGALACVDRATDEANCGSCGNVCPSGRECTAGSCRCPAPVLGTQRQISTADEVPPLEYDVATDGSHVAIVWTETTTYLERGARAYLGILDADGAPTGPPTVIAENVGPTYQQGLGDVRIAWSGTHYGIVWLADDEDNLAHLHFQRFTALGDPVGVPRDFTAEFGPASEFYPSRAGIAYAPGTGFALVLGQANQSFMLLVGDGTGTYGPPSPITNDSWSNPEMAGASDGTIGVLMSEHRFYEVNSLGSITLPPSWTREVHDPTVFHDGSEWWAFGGIAGINAADATAIGVIRPGSSTYTTLFAMTTSGSATHREGGASLAMIAPGAAVAVYTVGEIGQGYKNPITAVPLRIGAGTVATTGLATQVLPLPVATDVTIVSVRPGRAMLVWHDHRFENTELFAAPLDVTACN